MEIQEWLQTRLPSIAQGTQPLNAVFVSYKKVGLYGTGIFQPRPRLTIQVANGYSDPRPIFEAYANEIETGLMPIQPIMEDQARFGQQTAQSALRDMGVDNQSDLLFVVYVGLSGFVPSMDFIYSQHMANPNAKFIIVTCDCDLANKMFRINNILNMVPGSDFIVTPRCGGEETMGAILDNIIEAWPRVVSDAVQG